MCLVFGRRAVSGQQLFEAVDLVSGDALEDVGESGLRVDSVERGGLDQGVGDGGGVDATGRAHEEVVLPADRNRAFILPMSGWIAWSIVAGTRISVVAFALEVLCIVQAGLWLLSRCGRAWSSR